MGIQVGNIHITDPVILAPMSGVTDLPFRRLVKSYGAGLVVSEMIASQAMIRETRRTMQMAAHTPEEAPMAVQLAGCVPEVVAEAARLNADRGAAIIDINMGCPVKKVVNGQSGSALMRDVRQAGQILKAAVDAVDLPVTLKMRTGWDDASRNAPELARVAQDCGIQMITVHGRTRCQMYRGHADWDFIAEVKAAVSLPVIANGDINCFDDVDRAMSASGADGVMIGRGTYGRPWFVRDVMHYLNTGERREAPPLGEQLAVLTGHYDAMLCHYGTDVGLKVARKHLGWYTKGLPSSAGLRSQVNQQNNPEEVLAALRTFYQPLIEREAA